jgi:ORF6N domain
VRHPKAEALDRSQSVTGSQRTAPALVEQYITQSILVFRGHKVLLDEDLAILYGVATKVLLQAVKRNSERFPEDFMIQLTPAEWAALRSQNVTSNPQRGGRRYPPYAFTEQGVAMLSSVLHSDRAIAVNIEIMRAFVKLRELLGSNKELARRFVQLEARLDKKLTEHDVAIATILSAIREFMHPPSPEQRPIGFTANLNEKPQRQD